MKQTLLALSVAAALIACAANPKPKAAQLDPVLVNATESNIKLPTSVAPDKDAPTDVEGHPVTSVVVTQCNLIVAVYLTMQDGTLLRFDGHNKEGIKPNQLVDMAYTAGRSERVEVSCNGIGPEEYEQHGLQPKKHSQDNSL